LLLMGLALLLFLLCRLLIGFLLLPTTVDCPSRCPDCSSFARIAGNSSNRSPTRSPTCGTLCSASLLGRSLLSRRRWRIGVGPGLLPGGLVAGVFVSALLLWRLIFSRIYEDSNF
jgi:hypothetical protein